MTRGGGSGGPRRPRPGAGPGAPRSRGRGGAPAGPSRGRGPETTAEGRRDDRPFPRRDDRSFPRRDERPFPRREERPPREPEPAVEPPRIAVLYGLPFAPFVAPIVADLAASARERGHELHVIAAERADDEPARCARVDRLYLLPFDLPAGEEDTRAFVRRHFPRAEVLNPIAAHELCWDKLEANRHLLTRGVPVPGTLFTESAEEVHAFVAEHQFAILKERRSCGGQGHVVLCGTDDVLVGEAGRRRFVVELGDDPDAPRRLAEGVLSYPPPFYVQRLVGDSGPRGVFTPGRLLRAYVLGGRIAFWTERYRDRYSRPADWIVNVGLGAKVRFVLETSEELRKLALRAADVLGIRAGVVDIIRAGSGAFVLEADTDGRHMYIDRSFKLIPDYRAAFDLDDMIAAALANEEIPALAAPV